MARQLNKLTSRTVVAATSPGRYGDGGGLYLVVSPSGARKWVFRFTQAGRMTDMGLGSAAETTLARAREKAAVARSALAEGRNPLEDRRAGVGAPKPSFGKFADALLDEILPGFKNAKHQEQWRSTISLHAKSLYDVPVDAVTTESVLKVLRPIWQEKNETASRVRGRIERILDAAKAQGLRSGENPARWRGHLNQLLSRRRKLQRGHHPAMPYTDVPAFVAALRKRSATSARALEFGILTASRPGEVIGARREEFDLDKSLWVVPKERMKAGREHRVPLQDSAVAIVRHMLVGRDDDADAFIFPGQKRGQTLSNAAMAMLLERMAGKVTPHGFRSSFRDWAGEETEFARETAEAALAHVVGDQTERAYRRGDALEKRRGLMVAWADYCNSSQESGAEPVVSHALPETEDA